MDAVAKSNKIDGSQVLIDDEDFRLVKENGAVIAHRVSQSVLSKLSGVFGRGILLCLLYLIVFAVWCFCDAVSTEIKPGEIVLESPMAIKAAIGGAIVIAVLFAISFGLHQLDYIRRKARAALYEWKCDTETGWFYGSHGEPIVSARDAKIELTSEIIGRWMYIYRFHLIKNDEKLLLFESYKFKPTVTFIHLLIDWGFPGASRWEDQVYKIEKKLGSI